MSSQFRRAYPRAGCFLFLTLLFVSPARGTIDYHVSLNHPGDHLFHVTMVIPVEGREVTVALPAWNALYQVRDFAARIRDLNAICPAATAVPAHIASLDKQTWKLSIDGQCRQNDHNTFEVRYAIDWDIRGPFNSQLDVRHAFMNLAEILMYVPDRRAENSTLEFADVPATWRTASELPSSADNSYSAGSYDSLVDAPVEAGKYDELQFSESGAHFRVIVDSNNWNRPLLENSLHSITKYELQLMGGGVPFDPPSREYTFFFHISPDGDVDGGGMEHRNCTAIAASSTEAAIAIAAHEFFHVWNVKRIRPQALEPVDYTKEQYTRALWFAEGVTSAYASFTLERSGLWTKNQFYADLAMQISMLDARPARQWQSVESSSLDAWLEKYDSYRAPGRSISYYNKGQILGVMLDLAIRDATDNHKSLDDVLRRMYDEYARQGKFYDESAGIQSVVEEVSGKNFEDFFRRYVAGTDEIPYNEFLSFAGLAIKMEGGNPDGLDPQTQTIARATISEVAHPTDRQRRIREGLLRGATD